MTAKIITQPILLSCPCCGGKANTFSLLYRTMSKKYKHYVKCSKCGLTTTFSKYLKSAINRWNNRYG